MRPLPRLALILFGYALAAVLGAAAVWLKSCFVADTDPSGMAAFGDAVLFLAIAAVVAIGPTVLVFQWIGTRRRFWRVYSWASLVLSLTGLVEGALLLANPHSLGSFVDTLVMVAPLRVLSSPAFFAAFSPGLLPIAAPYRRTALLACVFEVCTMGSFAVFLLLHR